MSKTEINRLAALAALNAELTCEECEQSFNDPESGVTALCMTCWNNIVTKLRGEIDLLTAENYKMREGLEIGKSVLVLLEKALAELKAKDAKIQLALKELAHIEGEKNPTEIRVEQSLKG